MVSSLIVNPTHALLTELPSVESSLAGLAQMVAENDESKYAPVPQSQASAIDQALRDVRSALEKVRRFQDEYVAPNTEGGTT